MKKLFFSAIFMIAFSVTSFAKEVKTDSDLKTEKVETNTSQKDDECTTVRIRWNTVESDGNGG